MRDDAPSSAVALLRRVEAISPDMVRCSWRVPLLFETPHPAFFNSLHYFFIAYVINIIIISCSMGLIKGL